MNNISLSPGSVGVPPVTLRGSVTGGHKPWQEQTMGHAPDADIHKVSSYYYLVLIGENLLIPLKSS